MCLASLQPQASVSIPEQKCCAPVQPSCLQEKAFVTSDTVELATEYKPKSEPLVDDRGQISRIRTEDGTCFACS